MKNSLEEPVAFEQPLFNLRSRVYAVMACLAYSANSRQRIADQHVDDAGAAVAGGDQHRARRLLADFADDLRFVSAGCGSDALRAASAYSGSHHRQKLAFVGDVQRIQSQQFASAADRVAHGNLSSKRTCPAAIARQFVQRCRHAAARRIAHPADARARRLDQRLHQRQHGAGIGAQVGLQFQFAARQQNRDAVIADRAGEQHLVAGRAPNADQRSRREAGGRCRRS